VPVSSLDILFYFPGQYSVPVLRCPYQVITALIHGMRRLLPLRRLCSPTSIMA
jgi:hypothetical protein